MPATTETNAAAEAATTTPASTEAPASNETQPKLSPVELMRKKLGYVAKETAAPNEAKVDPTPADPAAKEAPPAETKKGAEGEQPAATNQDRPKVGKAVPLPPAAPAINNDVISKAIEEGIKAGIGANKKQEPAPAPKPTLNPDDQAEIELATYASEKLADKYADLPNQMQAWFKARDEFVTAKATELGGAQSQEFKEFLEGDEFKSFVRSNRPALRQGDRTKLEREKIKDEAKAESDKKLAEAEAKWRRELAELKHGPAIKAEVNAAVTDMLTDDDDVITAYRTNPDAALAERPIEAQEIHSIATSIDRSAHEYLRISRGLVDPSPDDKLHKWLDDFLVNQGKVLDSLPVEKRTRDGKVLVSMETYSRVLKTNPSDAGNYQTWNDKDVLTMLSALGKNAIKTSVQKVRTSLEKSGFQRKPVETTKTDDAQTGKAASAAPSPKASTARAPGPSGNPASNERPLHMKVLGYRGD